MQDRPNAFARFLGHRPTGLDWMLLISLLITISLIFACILFVWVPGILLRQGSGTTIYQVIPRATNTATVAVSPPTTTLPTGGKPFIGGPYANFIAAYGQPSGNGLGDSANFWGDPAHTITINVSPTSGTVTFVAVVGHTSWSNDETYTYCTQFLPDDAAEYNSVGRYTDFHSSVGDLVVSNNGAGTCVITKAQ